MAEYYGNSPTKDYFTLVSALEAKFSDTKVGTDEVDLFTLSTGFQQKERFEEQPQYKYRGAETGYNTGGGGTADVGEGGSFYNTVEVVPEDICDFCCTYPCPSDLPEFSPGTINFSMSDSGWQSHDVEVTGSSPPPSSEIIFSSLDSLSFSSLDSITDLRTSEPPSSGFSWSWGETSYPWGTDPSSDGGQPDTDDTGGGGQDSGYSEDTEDWGQPYPADKCLCGFNTTDPATSHAESYNQSRNYTGSWNLEFDVDLMHELTEYTKCGNDISLFSQIESNQSSFRIKATVCPSFSDKPIGETEFGTWYNPVGGIGAGPTWVTNCLYKTIKPGGWQEGGEGGFIGEFGLSEAAAVPGGGVLDSDLPLTVEIDCDLGGTCCCHLTDAYPWCSSGDTNACTRKHYTSPDCCFYGNTEMCNTSASWIWDGCCCNDQGELEASCPTNHSEYYCDRTSNCTWRPAGEGECWCENTDWCHEFCCRTYPNHPATLEEVTCAAIEICKVPVWKDWALDLTIKVYEPRVEAEIRIGAGGGYSEGIKVRLRTQFAFWVEFSGNGVSPITPGLHVSSQGGGGVFQYIMSQAGQDTINPPIGPFSPNCENQCTGWRVGTNTKKLAQNPNTGELYNWNDMVYGSFGISYEDNEDPLTYEWPYLSVINEGAISPFGGPRCDLCPMDPEDSPGCGKVKANANFGDSIVVEDECAEEHCTKPTSHSWRFEMDGSSLTLSPTCGSTSADCSTLSGGGGVGG